MSIFSSARTQGRSSTVAQSLLPGRTINLERMVSTRHIQALPSGQTLVTPPRPSEPVTKSPVSVRFLVPGFVSIALATFSLAGVAFALWLRTTPAGNADPRLFFNVFYFL